MPSKFQKFYRSYINNCISTIRTAFGPTEPIVLANSLKQGDPLSGLIYIMCDEVLYAGFQGRLPEVIDDPNGVRLWERTS